MHPIDDLAEAARHNRLMQQGHRITKRTPCLPRRVALTALAILPSACGVPPAEAARLAQDGEAASRRLIDDVSAARQRVERARDLLLLRAALTAPSGTTVEALRARPEVAAADARLAAASLVLDQGRKALEGLRDSYRAFGHVAAGRDPEAFDAMLDRASEDAEALRTLIERYASDGTELVESLPYGGSALGVVRFAGGLISRARTGRRLIEPNEALVELLDSLIASSDREATTLGPLLNQVGSDRAQDVVAALRQVGITRVMGATTLDRLAEAYGWSVSPLADQRLREAPGRRVALGLAAIGARHAASQPARLIDPAAGRAVLVALRERHQALRSRGSPDPNTLRDSLHRLAG
ncbi:hypothetical protein GXW78_04745 [Roseomonas terrae]|jgi:hypothetical protein|uniref:DUF2336 domain-containing protein n=1 Tax=Neoroseomonas terrae TaxID=424799 RepID=A0ABS5ED77_9PROT|nr:hypothetical protein [Neoroseomonas terrae]MBR0648959.1 hypothetical protein [Neoroseomonas terrae]